MNKKRIALLVLFCFIFNFIFVFADTTIPIGSNKLKLIGATTINGNALSEKNVHKEHFTVLPEAGTINDLGGQVNWSIVGNDEGIVLLTSGGSKNNEADVVIYRDKLKASSFTIRAVSPTHGTCERTVNIERNKVSAIKNFNIKPVLDTDAVYLSSVGSNSYSGVINMEGEQSLLLSYDLELLDSSFPVEDVTPDNFSVSINGLANGITVSKDEVKSNRFNISIDRGQLVSNSLNFAIRLNGSTKNGIAFDKTLNYSLEVTGIVGVDSNKYDLSISPSDSKRIHVINPTSSTYINMDSIFKLNGRTSPIDINWSIITEDPAISISMNGLVTIGSGANVGKVTVKATAMFPPPVPLEEVSDTYDIYLVKESDYYVDLSFNSDLVEKSIQKGSSAITIPMTTIVGMNLVNDNSKTVSYNITPFSAGISLTDGALVLQPYTQAGVYKITASVNGEINSYSNELILYVYEESELDPDATYTIKLSPNKAYENIPLSGEANKTITFDTKVLKDGALVQLPFILSMKDGPSTGVSLSGNTLTIGNNANAGYYTIVASLRDFPSIKVSKTIYVNKVNVEAGGWLILTDVLDEDISNIIIPSSGRLNVVMNTIVRKNGLDSDQPVKYSLSANQQGISLVNDILIIESTALAGQVSVDVSLINNPSVKNTINLTLSGGSGVQDNYSIQVRIDSSMTTVNIPRQAEPDLSIPFMVLIRNNGIIDDSKTANVSLSPIGEGIRIEKNNVIITSNAKAGNYNVVAKLSDNPNINHSATITLKDPNANSNIKALYIVAPDEIVIPQRSSFLTPLNYRVSLNGETLDKEPVTWELLTPKDGVTLSRIGELTIDSTTTPGEVWIRIRLESDNAITTTKRIKILSLQSSSELPDKFIVTGFVNDNANNKELQTTNMSGNKMTLKVKTLNEFDEEIFGSAVKMYLKSDVDGVTIKDGTFFNSFDVYANGILTNKEVVLVVESIYSESIKTEIPCIIKRPLTLNSYITFEKSELIKKDTFGVKAIVANNDLKNKKNVVLVIAMYKKNQLIGLESVSEVIDAKKTKEFRGKIILPSDLQDITVKAFICEGNSEFTAGKILGNPIIMKNNK